MTGSVIAWLIAGLFWAIIIGMEVWAAIKDGKANRDHKQAQEDYQRNQGVHKVGTKSVDELKPPRSQ